MSDDRPVYENIPVGIGELFTLRVDSFVAFPGLTVIPHYHLMFEVMWFRRAAGAFTLQSEKFTLRDNTLVFVPALVTHDMQLNAGHDHLRYLLQFEAGWLDALGIPASQELAAYSLAATLDEKEADRVESLFAWCAERRQLHDNQDPLFRALLKTLLIDVFNRIHDTPRVPERNADHHVDRLLTFLHTLDREKNYTITTEAAALACHCSPSWFARTFKLHFGMSFKAFILIRKINFAVRLLTTTDLRIVDIAQQSGFTDSACFCLKFRTVMGETPAGFRKKIYATAAMGQSSEQH